jgi:hypothetical protein
MCGGRSVSTNKHKCDEVKPRCGKCERSDIECEYKPVLPALKPGRTTSSVAPIPPLVTPFTLNPGQQPLYMLDLELYHHFIFEFSSTIRADKARREDLGRKHVEIARQHSYVFHNSLALSALHLLQHNQKRIELWERACYLQGVAIEQVQPILVNMTQDDAIPGLIFANNTAAFSLAEYMNNPYQISDSIDPIDKIIECFQLSRGISMLAGRYWPYLKHTWIKSNVPDVVDKPEKEMRSTLRAKFPTYRSVHSLALGQENSKRREVTLTLVDKTFAYIGHLMTASQDQPTFVYLIDAWSVSLPDEFREMLVERRPVALVILAYYAVLISLAPDIWYLNGWPALLINRITTVLGLEWAEFMHWAQGMILGEYPTPQVHQQL